MLHLGPEFTKVQLKNDIWYITSSTQMRGEKKAEEGLHADEELTNLLGVRKK